MDPDKSKSTGSTQGDPGNPRAVLRGLTILYIALIVGLIIFGGIIAFVAVGQDPEAEEIPELLSIIAAALTATTAVPAVLLGGTMVRRLAGAEGLTDLERAQRFVGAKIMLAAFAEGPGLFWGVLALLSGDLLHLIGLGFSVFALLLIFPREQEWHDATDRSGDRGEFGSNG